MKTAIVGWRGMVGSVLLQRMQEEGDFELIEPDFFSSSQAGRPAPVGGAAVLDAGDLGRLAEYPVILTCQGGSFTESTHGPLRDAGWSGIWIDAASTLRQREDCLIVLDPVNGSTIERGLSSGIKTFAGGNCTVSLLLLALLPLLKQDWVERVTSMTYQAVSGAGAAAVLELVQQIRSQAAALDRAPAEASALQLARTADQALTSAGVAAVMGEPIASNLLPWIDVQMNDGRSREEWKGEVETNKILAGSGSAARGIAVDGLCVRVPVFRCHSQALTVELREEVALEELEAAMQNGHQWLDYVPNDRSSSLARLSPAAVSDTLTIAVGRLRRVIGTPRRVTLFTVGDQLLWGAAEPLRRTLRMVLENAAAGE